METAKSHVTVDHCSRLCRSSSVSAMVRAANLLTNPTLDPYAKIPSFTVCAVRIGKTD